MANGLASAARLLVVIAFWLIAGCSSAAGGSICAIGSEGCICTSGGGCDQGLSCLSSVCVDPGHVPDAGRPVTPDGGTPVLPDSGTSEPNPPPPGCVTETYCAP